MDDSLLEELEAAANERHSGWSSTLAPGLPRERIDEILAPLGGWRPAEDVLALYAWHNGQVGPDEHCLWVPCGLLPLEQAVEMLLDLRKSLPLWPPLLPICQGGKMALEAPLSRRRVGSQPLYLRSDEGAPFRAFNSVKGLLQASAACYRAGVFRWSDEYAYWEDGSEDDGDEKRHALRLRVNRGASPTLWDTSEELGKHWIDPHDASTWPRAWHGYIGFDADAFRPRGATASITDVVVGRVDWSRPVIVAGPIQELRSGPDLRVTLSDGTQFLEVICKGVLASGIVLGDHFEFELERALDTRELEELRREDQAFDRAMRAQLRDVMDRLQERVTGNRPGANELGLADFAATQPGRPEPPAFVARRAALVERIARDDADEPLDALSEGTDEAQSDLWSGPDPVEPASDVDALAALLLKNYRNNYKLVQKYAPVDARELDEFDEHLYTRVARALKAEGFACLGDWEVANMRRIFPNFPRIAMRSFADAKGTVAAFYTFHANGWSSMLPPRKPPSDGILDLVSAFGDGRWILTTSAGDLLKYEAATRCDRECVPLGSRVGEVVRRHRERVGAARPSGKPTVARTLEEYLRQAQKRHKAEREFHLGRVLTPAELVRLGTNPELADRVHAAMKRIAATIDSGER